MTDEQIAEFRARDEAAELREKLGEAEAERVNMEATITRCTLDILAKDQKIERLANEVLASGIRAGEAEAERDQLKDQLATEKRQVSEINEWKNAADRERMTAQKKLHALEAAAREVPVKQRKAIADCLKGNEFSQTQWVKGYCVGIVAALTAFDHEGKRLAEVLNRKED